MNERFLTVAELSTRWTIPQETIREWTRAGRLKFATKLGQAWRFPLSKLEMYEEKQQVSK